MKFEIKNRFSGDVQFSCDLSAEMDSSSESFRLGAATKIAIKASADLSRANLSGANLYVADLYVADLSVADLYRANLSRANLSHANLSGANLYGADLSRAKLSVADLSRANLDGRTLVGDRPVLTIGPIGSESRQLVAYMTPEGARIKAGCFFGSVSEFESAIAAKHGDNQHAMEYRAALEMIKAHAEIWAPVEDVAP